MTKQQEKAIERVLAVVDEILGTPQERKWSHPDELFGVLFPSLAAYAIEVTGDKTALVAGLRNLIAEIEMEGNDS